MKGFYHTFKLGNAGQARHNVFVRHMQTERLRNSMKATADKVTECMDGIRELNELEKQLKAEEQESEDED